MKKHHNLTGHHTLPRSRGGTESPSNMLEVAEYLHRAWHCLFWNLTIQEIHEFIDAVWANGGNYHDKLAKWEKSHKPRK